jgi:hypothetical protein
MKTAIGGNLVRWNATHFGTNYLFLEKFLRRKDCFMQWMATPQLQKSGYLDSNAGNMHMLVSLAYHDGIISKELWNLFNHYMHFSGSRSRKGF